MAKLLIFLSAVSLACLSSCAVAAPACKPKCLNTYSVQAGDTFTTIAAKNNLSLNDLVKFNPFIKNINVIFPNNQLCLEWSSMDGPLEMPFPELYEVQPGDSVWDIAVSHNLLPKDLYAFNPDLELERNELKPNQLIRLRPLATATTEGKSDAINLLLPYVTPTAESQPNAFIRVRPASSTEGEPECLKIYSVQAGDTFTTIADENNLSLNDLVKFNPFIKNINVIFPNNQLCLEWSSMDGSLEMPFPELYEVQPGDSVWDIAVSHNLMPEDLYAFNPDLKRDGLILNAFIRVRPQATRSDISPDIGLDSTYTPSFL